MVICQTTHLCVANSINEKDQKSLESTEITDVKIHVQCPRKKANVKVERYCHMFKFEC